MEGELFGDCLHHPLYTVANRAQESALVRECDHPSVIIVERNTWTALAILDDVTELTEQVWREETMIEKELWESVADRLVEQSWQFVEKSEVFPSLPAPDADTRRKALALLSARLREKTVEFLHAQRTTEEATKVWNQIHQAAYGSQDSYWLSFYDAFRRFGLEVCERLTGLMHVAQNAGWWWPYTKTCIITDRPVVLTLDENNRLHNATGPCVAYPDGFALYCWHGVRVPRDVIEKDITGQDWLAESNAEIRRIMAEKMGWEKMLQGSGAVKVNSDDFGTLWHIKDPTGDDEDIYLVEVINSTPEPDGTWKHYVIQVDPQCRPILGDDEFGEPQELTAKNAVASTFGLRGEEYHLAAES